jgi:hypothetical protein
MTKSDLAAQLAACRRELAERRRVGGLLAAALGALATRSELHPYDRAECTALRAEWDAIAREGGEGGG